MSVLKLPCPNMRPHEFSFRARPAIAILQPKLDGIRVHYFEGKFYFKSGHLVHGLEEHAEEIENMTVYYPHLDTEATVPGVDFDTASGIIRAHNHPDKSKIVLNIFDAPCVPGYLINRLSNMMAIKSLGKLTKWEVVPHVLAYCTADVKMWYHIYHGRSGYEGMMIKNPWGSYVDCGTTRRSWDWMRWKPELTFDAEIVRVEEGRGKFKNSVGTLIVRRVSTGEIIRAGRGKLNDQQADHIYENFERYCGRTCEILFQRRTKTGGYRHPRFRRWR